jgi:hypothetical protein
MLGGRGGGVGEWCPLLVAGGTGAGAEHSSNCHQQLGSVLLGSSNAPITRGLSQGVVVAGGKGDHDVCAPAATLRSGQALGRLGCVSGDVPVTCAAQAPGSKLVVAACTQAGLEYP